MADASQASAFTVEYGKHQRVIRSTVSLTTYSPDDKQNGDKVECTAIWDTGATGSVISRRIAERLSLSPVGKQLINHANGTATVNVYIVNILLPNQIRFKAVEVTEGVFEDSFDVLIGMDIISRGDFSFTNCRGLSVFSFRIPSMEVIDYVSDARNKKKTFQVPIKNSQKKLGRNEPCFCGSGKKYKFCHGKNT
ncbi:MAG: retroviral-like aspartic protease family protein [Bacteroidales bacterium]|nr:retroviral-like aspartic protease family protein [Bacteroidales bacterium]